MIQSLQDDFEDLIESLEPAVFYFDDFLGANYYEVSGSNYDNTRLLQLFKRIRKNKNKRLIVTSRTVVINKAKSISEKIDRIIKQFTSFELSLNLYSDEEKKDIIRKHCNYYEVAYSEEDESLIEIIACHDNFSPRIIDHYFNKYSFSEITLDSIKDELIQGFKYPSEVWAHSYRNQISIIDRMFLSALFLYSGPVMNMEMKVMFQSRIKFEKENNNYSENYTEYRKSFKSLDGTFIKFEKGSSFIGENVITFNNPSVKDFLSSEYKSNPLELKSAILAFSNIQQLSEQFSHGNKDFERIFVDIDELFFCRNTINVILDHASWDIVKFLSIGSNYYEGEKKILLFNKCFPILNNTFIDEILGEGDVLDFFIDYREVSALSKYVNNNFDYVFNSILMTLEEEEEIDDFLQLLNIYGLQLSVWLENDNNRTTFNRQLTRIKKSIVNDEIYDRIDEVYNWQNVEDVSDAIKDELLKDKSILNFREEFIDQYLNEFDWQNRIVFNKRRDFID